ncbi:MAG: NifU family protein [Bacteroidales bacterium]|jgi:Fe-S cluster biogenesis protein NfuA|nr:NifU family protein [Bacteroidales bacterium]
MQEKATLQDKVVEILNQIRPYLQQDGGDLEFIELTEDNVVKVRLTGACGCCPHAIMTLKQGVEQAVRRAIPEIKSVEAA